MFCKRGKGSRIYSNRVRLIQWHLGRVKNFHLKCFQLDNIQIHSFPSSSHHRATDVICDRKSKKQKKIGIRSLEPCRVNPARLRNGDKRRKLVCFFLLAGACFKAALAALTGGALSQLLELNGQ